MTLERRPVRPLTQWLGVRLAFAFAISLLPLGLISGMQSSSLVSEARARSTAALLGETLLASVPEARLIQGARVATKALAITIPSLISDTGKCSLALQRLQDEYHGDFSFIAFVPLTGDVRCTSNGKPLDLSNSKRLRKMVERPEPDTVVIRNAVASGQSVLAFGHPVFDESGALLGYVSISMPHAVLQEPKDAGSDLRPKNLPEPITLITFDHEGVVLTSSSGLDDAAKRLPNDRKLADLASNVARTFAATSNDGNERIFVVLPLVEGKVFAIGSWPLLSVGDSYSFWVSPYLMPALMWLASLLVAMLASERLVTRHIRTLRRAITSFARGNHRMDGPEMPGAALELREVADSYLKMKFTILRNAAELEDMVHQREVLLREVHHRVKNNLQLISSIINMQMRQSHSRDAQVLIKGLQDRVMSLATIHRGLYQTSGLADVHTGELLSDIVHQVLKMAAGPGRLFDVKTHFDEMRMTPDQAVPLSLLLTEALTNAIKHAGTDLPGPPRIVISLRREDGDRAILLISNSVSSDPEAAALVPGTGLGKQLLMAFSQQLGAQSETTLENGTYTLTVRFTVRALDAGEDRNDIADEHAVDTLG